MTMKQWLLPSLFASTCLFSITAGAGPIENYSPVTADRLKNPEPANWMLIAGLTTVRDIAPWTRSTPRTSKIWCRCGPSRPAWSRTRFATNRQQWRHVRHNSDGAGNRPQRQNR